MSLVVDLGGFSLRGVAAKVPLAPLNHHEYLPFSAAGADTFITWNRKGHGERGTREQALLGASHQRYVVEMLALLTACARE